MPLPPPGRRTCITLRTVTCTGYAREDGLLDVEGHLVDTRGYESGNEWRGIIPAGTPVHDMWVRLTIDAELTIQAAVSATDAAPYPCCPEVTPATSRLVGLKIGAGFKREVHARIGNTQGCTHVVALVESLASVAVQTVMGTRRGSNAAEQYSMFGARTDRAQHPLIDSCHSYAADSPITQKLWPMFYRPSK